MKLASLLLIATCFSSFSVAAQPEPLCSAFHRLDAKAPAPCSGVLAPEAETTRCLRLEDTLAACQDGAQKEALRCEVQRKSLLAEIDRTENARVACEASRVPKVVKPPEPTPVYAKAGFWLGLAVTVGAGVGMVLDEPNEGWTFMGGFGLGVVTATVAF